jgi:flavin reductase (DIM6/NTAB) family NADH-FMN oxidoreductase RutF
MFGVFHFYSFNPPSVMIGIKPEKYTHELIDLHKEFIINIPTTDQLEKVKICGKLTGKDSEKFKETSFTRQRGKRIKSFLIEECTVNLECKVVHKIEHGGSHTWFIGKIEEVHVDSEYSRSNALMFWLGQFRELGEILEGRKDDEIFL